MVGVGKKLINIGTIVKGLGFVIVVEDKPKLEITTFKRMTGMSHAEIEECDFCKKPMYYRVEAEIIFDEDNSDKTSFDVCKKHFEGKYWFKLMKGETVTDKFWSQRIDFDQKCVTFWTDKLKPKDLEIKEILVPKKKEPKTEGTPIEKIPKKYWNKDKFEVRVNNQLNPTPIRIDKIEGIV